MGLYHPVGIIIDHLIMRVPLQPVQLLWKVYQFFFGGSSFHLTEAVDFCGLGAVSAFATKFVSICQERCRFPMVICSFYWRVNFITYQHQAKPERKKTVGMNSISGKGLFSSVLAE